MVLYRRLREARVLLLLRWVRGRRIEAVLDVVQLVELFLEFGVDAVEEVGKGNVKVLRQFRPWSSSVMRTPA